MSYLLDTCVISEFLKKRPDANVVKWLAGQMDESLYLSVLTLGEVRKGISRLKPSKRRDELDEWFDQIRSRFERRVLVIGPETADIWGRIKGEAEEKGVVLSVIDSLIAATALKNNLTVVTRNENDFAATGAKILNVWK